MIGSGDSGEDAEDWLSGVDRRTYESLTSRTEYDEFALKYAHEWQKNLNLTSEIAALKETLSSAEQRASLLTDERRLLHATTKRALTDSDKARARAAWALTALIAFLIINWLWR